MKIIVLRLALVRCSVKLRNRFLSVATNPYRIRTMALLLQLPARSLRVMRAWHWEYLGWRDQCFAAFESIDWLHLKITTSRWLRQPCDPTQWRVLDSRLFDEMFRVNHKKM